MKSALILYPNQLFSFDLLPQVDTILLVEEALFFGVDQEYPARLHKQKLILHRAAMRRYAEEILWPKGVNVDYVELDVFMKTGDVLDRLKKVDHLYVFDPIDERISRRLLQARRERPEAPAIEFLPSPNFYLKDQEIRQYLSERHKDSSQEFYQWQRERFNILIGEDYKPLGGSWSFDKQKQTKVAAGVTLPSFAAFGSNKWVEEATNYVNEHFSNNEGSTDFIWPTARSEALEWLKDFVAHRLKSYATHQMAFDSEAPWIFHSALSSSLNIGLLLPRDIVETVTEVAQEQDMLPHAETLIRKVIGDREMTRGLYISRADSMRTANPLSHKRKLTRAWYDGTTGITPYDDAVKRLDKHAYLHQVERQNIIGCLMVMAEIDPADMHRFFTEKFIDAYEWANMPHVHALSIFIDVNHEQAEQTPCLVTAETLQQFSSYPKEVWADVWDGLYWRFIEKHKIALGKNPHLKTTVHHLNQLDADRKRIIQYRAEDFLNQFTQ